VSGAKPTIAGEVERYLRTGETDPHPAAWPGNGFMERANRADSRGGVTGPLAATGAPVKARKVNSSRMELRIQGVATTPGAA